MCNKAEGGLCAVLPIYYNIFFLLLQPLIAAIGKFVVGLPIDIFC
jgi:hypothetical protein